MSLWSKSFAKIGIFYPLAAPLTLYKLFKLPSLITSKIVFLSATINNFVGWKASFYPKILASLPLISNFSSLLTSDSILSLLVLFSFSNIYKYTPGTNFKNLIAPPINAVLLYIEVSLYSLKSELSENIAPPDPLALFSTKLLLYIPF